MRNANGELSIESFMNLLLLCGIYTILFAAFYVQTVWRELPCPLCFMQRVGYVCAAFGFLLNFQFGIKASHYTIVLLGALFTAAVSIRQIMLHIVPGTGAYGSPMFGYHLYTLSFLGSVSIIFFTSLLLAVDRQYYVKERIQMAFPLKHILFLIMLVILLGELSTAYSICGFGQCPDNPI